MPRRGDLELIYRVQRAGVSTDAYGLSITGLDPLRTTGPASMGRRGTSYIACGILGLWSSGRTNR